jgi:hypothetical protein
MDGRQVTLGVVIGLVLGAMFEHWGELCAANGEDAAVATWPTSTRLTGGSKR